MRHPSRCRVGLAGGRAPGPGARARAAWHHFRPVGPGPVVSGTGDREMGMRGMHTAGWAAVLLLAAVHAATADESGALPDGDGEPTTIGPDTPAPAGLPGAPSRPVSLGGGGAVGATMTAAPGTRFRDCDDCSEMVLLPDGRYRMGSPEGEAERDADEGPEQDIVIDRPIAFGRYEVTVGQFAAFVAATDYRTDAERGAGGEPGCLRAAAAGETGERIVWQYDPEGDWRQPGFEQGDRHPVVCVSWYDAMEYAAWLSERTGHDYRLPSEAEWEYAARATNETAFYFGNDVSGICAHANHADDSHARSWGWERARRGADCDDGAARTAPVGSYEPNLFGLNDVLGNVWEWTLDCYVDTLADLPADGSARVTDACRRRAARGGSWRNLVPYIRAANRYRISPVTRSDFVGFRVVRVTDAGTADTPEDTTLPGVPPPEPDVLTVPEAASEPAEATGEPPADAPPEPDAGA